MHSVFLPKSSATNASGQVPRAESITVQPAEWPWWAKAIALLKKDGDSGVGDTVERVIGPANSAAFQAWYLATFKKSCRCSQRKAEWNARFKY